MINLPPFFQFVIVELILFDVSSVSKRAQSGVEEMGTRNAASDRKMKTEKNGQPNMGTFKSLFPNSLSIN